MIKRIMTCSGEDSFVLIIEVDTIFTGIWDFMGSWDFMGIWDFMGSGDYSGKEQTPQFMSDHTDSCYPNAVQCKVRNMWPKF